MGYFSQLEDDDAELLSGGALPQSTVGINGSNFGEYSKSSGSILPSFGGSFDTTL